MMLYEMFNAWALSLSCVSARMSFRMPCMHMSLRQPAEANGHLELELQGVSLHVGAYHQIGAAKLTLGLTASALTGFVFISSSKTVRTGREREQEGDK